jgi:16S rRNA (adenine1518-N6/adenine1519-N6)-dimethyltransferase
VTTAGRRRALGQHFLRDAGIAQRIVEIAGLTPADLCVEIGPGEGVLTFLLAERAGRLLALEVDEKLVEGLRVRLAALPHVEVRQADARSFDYSTLPALRPSPEGRVVIVGNLPYSVSKPILERLVAARTAVSEMVLTLQKEVAERVAAGPGSKRYGALSVLTQLYCDAYALEYAVLKERFDRWKLPHLRLEAEATPGSIEQLNVRVQSFVESLL